MPENDYAQLENPYTGAIPKRAKTKASSETNASSGGTTCQFFQESVDYSKPY